MKCKGCEGEITGFETDGYCEYCLCTECGNTLVTETERACTVCLECQDEEAELY